MDEEEEKEEEEEVQIKVIWTQVYLKAAAKDKDSGLPEGSCRG